MTTATQTARRMLTTSELAVALGVSAPTLRKAIETGVVVAVRAGRFQLFDPTDVPRIREAMRAAGLLANDRTVS